MKKEERCIYYDTDLQIEMYEFKGIEQKFVSHFHKNYVIGVVQWKMLCNKCGEYSAD